MSRQGVFVVVPEDLVSGYRLAGARTMVASSSQEAAGVVDGMLAEGVTGVVAVYEPYLAGIDPVTRARFEAEVMPVVVPLPAGLREPDEAERRARLSEMLSRAVGYHITFGVGEAS